MPGQRTVTFSTVPEVRTVEDLFAIATAMEREAARRYAELANRLERQGEAPLAVLFRRLEREESGHEDGLGAWAGRQGITSSPTLGFQWDMPEITSDEDFAEAGGDFLATPWRVLAMAVRNEERAFAFYANVAAKASDADVRRYAEAMAREELNHVALLRGERRRAWRQERQGRAADAPAAEIPADAEALDRYLRDGTREGSARWRNLALAAEAAGDGTTAALFRVLVSEEADDKGSRRTADLSVVPPERTIRGLLRDEARRTEAAYDVLMSVAEKARDDDVIAKAQTAAQAALLRLALLRDRLAALS
jgi:rubrerythrin